MQKGIKFYRVIWDCDGTYVDSIEASHNRRYLAGSIKKNDVNYFNKSGVQGKMVKIQEIETPLVEIEWLLKLFTEAGNKKSRNSHRDQAAYVLRLVETCAARVILETGEIIER